MLPSSVKRVPMTEEYVLAAKENIIGIEQKRNERLVNVVFLLLTKI